MRPKYVLWVGKTSIQIQHIQPGEYDLLVRPEVPLRNIKNTKQKKLAINPEYTPKEYVELEWVD